MQNPNHHTLFTPLASALVRVRIGAEWVLGTLRVWSGGEWLEGIVRSWDGGSWN
jgi:hypothetical protein